MRLFEIIKDIASPVPSFGNTGPIKFRSMSFGTVDSLKAYLDATLNMTPEGKIAITCEDAEQVIDYLPSYFDNKEVEYISSYDDYFKSTGAYYREHLMKTAVLPKRVTGYLSSYQGSFINE